MGLLGKFIKDDRGQSMTEYVLILFMVVVVIKMFSKEFKGVLTGLIKKFGENAGEVTEEFN